MSPRTIFPFLGLLVFGLASCSQPLGLTEFVVTAVPTVSAVAATSISTLTPTQAPTVQPSATPEATATPLPTATSTPEPMRVPQYGVFEQSFDWSSADYANPWEQVQVAVTLTAPSGRTATVGGFYYEENVWRARFAPDELGDWVWLATIEDGTKGAQETGSFTVVGSDWPGPVRQNPDNPFRWVFADGSPYYPLGLGDCVLDYDHSGTPLDNWGFDGDFRNASMPRYGQVTDFDTYWQAYSAAGINLYRWSVDNCAFNLYKQIDPTGNVYGVREGQWGDELVQGLRGYNVRTFMTLFGFTPPFPDGANDPAKMAAVERYVKYVVDRYGAYVDFWELMNEATALGVTMDKDWYEQVGGYLHSIDPYHHPLSTSWPQPGLDVIDIAGPHWYQHEGDFESDKATQQQIADWRSYGKPIIFGEQGNSIQNWDATSAMRMRIRAWTAFFNEATLIFWNSSFVKDYRADVASNLYMGPEERGYLKVLQDFTRGFDARAVMTKAVVSNPARVRGYALRGPTMYAAYLHAYTDHTHATTGIKLTIETEAGGLARWIDPTTGTELGRVDVVAGKQTLTVPDFTIDVALKVTGQ